MKLSFLLIVIFGIPCRAQPQVCQPAPKVRCVDAGNRAGWPGATLDSWLTAAARDLTDGGTIRVDAGAYTLAAQFHFAGNTHYQFDPRAVVTVSNSYAGKVAMDMTGVTGVELQGGVFDGNRAQNPNTLDGLYVIRSSRITISKTVIRNFRGNGINLTSGTAFVTISDSEIYNNGAPLPAATGWGISLSPSSGALSHIQIGPGNNIHGNNSGILLENSTSSANPVEDVRVFANRIHHNANDGALFAASNDEGGILQGIKVENNESHCNGWPANGAGFSPNCLPAGPLQSGGVPSSGGSGFDFIQNGDALLTGVEVIGNKAHDNAYDGFDATYNPSVIVRTSGTALTWVSGPRFKTEWKQSQPVLINGAVYLIASCGSRDRCTLQSPAGNLDHAAFQGTSAMKIAFSRNSAIHNGNRNIPPNVGAGFYSQFADGVAYSDNEAVGNNLEGFELFYCNFSAFHGDKAFGNNAGNTPERNIGFSVVGGLDNSFESVSADDFSPSPHQTIGLRVGVHGTNTVIRSSAVKGRRHAIEDLGVKTSIQNVGTP